MADESHAWTDAEGFVWYMPTEQPAGRELARLAARERELLAQLDERERLGSESLERTARLTSLIGKQQEFLRWLAGGHLLPEVRAQIDSLLSTPDAQKAAGELEELRAALVEAGSVGGKLTADNMALRADNEALRARVRELEAACDAEMQRVKACEHIAEGDEGWEFLVNLCPSTAAVAALKRDRDLRFNQAEKALKAILDGDDPRLSRLDQLLASEEVPEGLLRELELSRELPAEAGLAWRWFREALGAPTAEPRQKDVLPASTTCPACGHIVFVPTPAEPQEERQLQVSRTPEGGLEYHDGKPLGDGAWTEVSDDDLG